MKLFKRKVYGINNKVMYVSWKTYRYIKRVPRCKFYSMEVCDRDKELYCKKDKCNSYDCAILEGLIDK